MKKSLLTGLVGIGMTIILYSGTVLAEETVPSDLPKDAVYEVIDDEHTAFKPLFILGWGWWDPCASQKQLTTVLEE